MKQRLIIYQLLLKLTSISKNEKHEYLPPTILESPQTKAECDPRPILDRS